MGPPPRSLTAEANSCFMVRVPHGPNRIQGCGASIAPDRGLPSDQLYRTSNNEGHRVAETLDTKVPIQGCVKTRESNDGQNGFPVTVATCGAEYEEAIGKNRRYPHAFHSLVYYVHDVVREHDAGIRCASLRGRGDLPNRNCVNYGSRSEDDARNSNHRRRTVPNLRPANRQFCLEL